MGNRQYDPVTAAILITGAVTAGVSYKQGQDQRKAIKNAQADATARNDKALADAQAAKDIAGQQAQAAIDSRKRASTQTIFTSPLGIAGQANTAKKMLLGS